LRIGSINFALHLFLLFQLLCFLLDEGFNKVSGTIDSCSSHRTFILVTSPVKSGGRFVVGLWIRWGARLFHD
jgi:hypothetical protein